MCELTQVRSTAALVAAWLFASCTEPKPIVSGDYTLSLSPASLTIVQGGTGTTTISVYRQSFTGPVTFSLEGAPAGITASFDAAASDASTAVATISVEPTALAGLYDLEVAGTASPGLRKTSLTVTVSEPPKPPDFTLSLTPVTLRITQGTIASAAINIARTNFAGPVTFALGGAPTGVSAEFNPAPPNGFNTWITVSVDASVPTGTYNLTVQGSNAAIGSRSAPLDLSVLPSGMDGNVVLMDVSSFASCALRASGRAFCWGRFTGDGTTLQRLTPTPVAGNLTFSTLMAASHSCALTISGSAYCWGLNDDGEVGDGTTTGRLVPTAVVGGVTFASLAVGNLHTCGLTAAGVAYCWGSNSEGELGDGTTQSSLVPIRVAGTLSFAAISAGWHKTCGVSSGGDAYCWGANYDGQLGDGTTTDRHVPTAVAGGLRFAAISARATAHTCGLTTAGTAYCWGYNVDGELGDGTTSGRLTPTAVAGGVTFTMLSIGHLGSDSCGVSAGGEAYCWGKNDSGQLGDGTTTDRWLPTRVAGALVFASISTSLNHSCGLTRAGIGYCWGDNSAGQLGDGTTTQRLVPTAVGFPP